MKTESVRIEDLKADPRNARKHSPANLAKLRASYRRFGQQRPILVGLKNVVIAGNGIWTAMKLEGATAVDIVRTALKGAELKAYAVADNLLGEASEWEQNTLAELLKELQAEDDTLLTAIGSSQTDLDKLLTDLQPSPPAHKETRSRSEHRCPSCGHVWTGSSHPAK